MTAQQNNVSIRSLKLTRILLRIWRHQDLLSKYFCLQCLGDVFLLRYNQNFNTLYLCQEYKKNKSIIRKFIYISVSHCYNYRVEINKIFNKPFKKLWNNNSFSKFIIFYMFETLKNFIYKFINFELIFFSYQINIPVFYLLWYWKSLKIIISCSVFLLSFFLKIKNSSLLCWNWQSF